MTQRIRGHSLVLALASLLLLAFSGCVGPVQEAGRGDAPASSAASGSTADSPLDQPNSPLDQPESPLQPGSPMDEPYVFSLDIPESEDDTGTVIGRVVAQSPPARVYLAGQFLLGNVIYSEGEVSVPMLSLSLSTAPQADLRNDEGDFAFLNVEPGQYGFVIYTPLSSYAAPDESETGLFFFDVIPGEVTDLGAIVIE